MVIYLSSDNVVEITDVRDRRTGAPITGATVTAELIDPADPETILATVNCTDEGEGQYLGTLPETVTSTLEEGTTYRLTVTTAASGRTVVKRIDLRPRWASAND